MNCTHVRGRLSDLLYEELSSGEIEQVKEHLTQCPACKSEYDSLQDLRRMLDGVRAPTVSVNTPGMFRQALEIHSRRARRWRRAAVALAGLAATVLAVILFRLEIRAGSNQVVIRWGSSTSGIETVTNPKSEPSEHHTAEASYVPASEAELQPLRGLIHALDASMDQLSREVENRDQRQQHNIVRLQEQVTQLRVMFQRQMATYLADSSKKGENR